MIRVSASLEDAPPGQAPGGQAQCAVPFPCAAATGRDTLAPAGITHFESEHKLRQYTEHMTPDYTSIRCDLQDGVARITLNRPPLNILNLPMMEELNQALGTIQSKAEVKLLVIAAQGKAFSAGVDIKDHTPDKVHQMIETFHGMFRLLSSLAPPTLAVVDGAALGGGCELATFCDLVLASQRSTLGQPEIKVGVFPPVAAVILPHLVGRNKTLELLLTGQVIAAAEAERIGLINRVFPDENFQTKVDEFIARLTSLSAPVLKLTKKAVDQAMYASFDAGMATVEKVYLDELMRTKDAHEGLKAFIEKRPPVWQNE